MNKNIKLLLIFGFTLIIFYIGFSASRPYIFSWQGPSPAFRDQYDLDGDGEISRIEWESPAFGTNILSSSAGHSRRFISMDCDENGRVTWGEYHAQQFRRQSCTDISLMDLVLGNIDSDSPKLDIPPFPVVLLEQELDLLNDPTVNDHKKIHPGAYLRTKPLTENKFDSDFADKIQLACNNVVMRNLPVDYNDSSGLRQSIGCDITNSHSDILLTMAVLEITVLIDNNTFKSIHVKSIVIDPHSSEKIVIYYQPDSVPLSTKILEVRGMQA